jgi:hypothetical protein
MGEGEFQFEDCLLKHFIRRDVWLPHCRDRLKKIRRAVGKSKKLPPRRLKYFTFCAVGALDVLLLDRAKVLRRSAAKEFDTVYFFDRDEDSVVETRKRIPGAIGFPGDFVKVVLETEHGIGLEAPENAENTREVRQRQTKRAQYEKFLSAFPFDVVNLDVEQYLFRPKEQLPGKLTTALRKIFDWQKRTGQLTNGRSYSVEEFTLMFTTRVGPANLPEDYLAYLRETCLQQNLNTYQELQAPFDTRSNGKNVANFFADDFPSAFKLAVPKSLVELALEGDWYTDGEKGIEVYQFERNSNDGPYTMLHMAMTIRRQEPPKERRAPGQQIPATAQSNHKDAIVRLFEGAPIGVEDIVAGARKDELKADLQDLFNYRKRYYEPPEQA